MATTQINPTRMELTRLKKKLGTAVKGHRLLKDKRDELMREFLDLVKVNMELREKVEKGIQNANRNFVLAKAGMSDEELRTALMAPKQEISLITNKKNVMSVDIPVYDFKTRSADENDICFDRCFELILISLLRLRNHVSLWQQRLRRPDDVLMLLSMLSFLRLRKVSDI